MLPANSPPARGVRARAADSVADGHALDGELSPVKSQSHACTECSLTPLAVAMTATAQPRRCGACGALGHNARTCPGDGEGRALFRSSSMPSLSMRRTGSLDNLASVVDALGEDDGELGGLEATEEEEEQAGGQQTDRERKKGAPGQPAQRGSL